MTGPLRLKLFPGVLYDGDGTLLAGDGPEMTQAFADTLPHKAAISHRPSSSEVTTFNTGDRLWVLPDSFGAPPVLPMVLLTDLAEVVRCGRKVGLAAHSRQAYEQARDALVLLLNDSGGRA